jgi:ribosomal-protein-alanine N-acetyltransferase
MKFKFVPMNRAYATEIKAKWHYSGEYSFYDYSQDDSIDDPQNWNNVFGVLNVDIPSVAPTGSSTDKTRDSPADPLSELIGEFTIYIEEGELWVGCGMKPTLTGKGYGEAFVRAGVEFGIDYFHYRGKFVKLAVLETNLRAIKVYQRVGFTIFSSYTEEIGGKTLQFVKLRYPNPQRSN